jgi:hypothetical protein
VTATFRNLALTNQNKALFLDSGCIADLCKLLATRESDYKSSATAEGNLPLYFELVFNISRVLSKLTLYGECRSVIMKDVESLNHMIDIIERFSTKYVRSYPFFLFTLFSLSLFTPCCLLL